ncbi:restriction endonuclease subunit S, partial [Mycoplasma sp. 1012]
NIPSIRFKEFTHAWEQDILENLYTFGKTGGTPLTTNKKFYNGKIPFLTIKDITNSEKYLTETEKHISEDGINNSSAWLVPKDSLNLSIYASIGKITINKVNLATSQAIFSIILKEKDLLDFYFYNLTYKNFKKHWNKVLSTGTQPNLSSEIVNSEIIFKSKENKENILVGKLFTLIDSLLSLHKRKLTALEKIKEKLLERMFV